MTTVAPEAANGTGETAELAAELQAEINVRASKRAQLPVFKLDKKQLAADVKTLHNAMREHSASLLEREGEVRIFWRGVLSKSHSIFYGEAGNGKSMVIDHGCSHLPQSPDPNRPWLFKTQFHDKMNPEELAGPIALTALERDELIHNTVGFLPDSRWVFGDELFDALAGTLRMLLMALNEREFRNGHMLMDLDLEAFWGSTNFEPTDPKLHAFQDRFPQRSWVEELVADQSWYTMAELALAARKGGGGYFPTNVLDDDALKRLQLAAFNVDVPTDVLQKWLTLIREARGKELIGFSPRRAVMALFVAQAETILNGRSTMTVNDLVVVSDVFPDSREEQTTMEKLVADLASNTTKEARKFKDMLDPYTTELQGVREIINGGGRPDRDMAGRLFEIGPAIKEIVDQAQVVIDKANTNGDDSVELQAIVDEGNAARKFISTECLGG